MLVDRVALACWLLSVVALVGCGSRDEKLTIDLWHQMRPEDRAVLEQRVAEFERQNDVDVRPLYKETEELRSGMVAGLIAGSLPEVVYGASDAAGFYHAMGALADLSKKFGDAELADFDRRALVRIARRGAAAGEDLAMIGDRFGNHLALVYNKKLVPQPPRTTDELVRIAEKNTVDDNDDGIPDRFGLVWNYTEPFFVVPFLTGYGAWVFDEASAASGSGARPALDTPQSIAAYQFVASLQHEHHVLPRSADYEAAQALFPEGKAAMIIDGDWSWQGYLAAKSDDFDPAVALLPSVSEKGRPPRPMGSMVAPKGYSLSILAAGKEAEAAVELIRFLTSRETQAEYLRLQRVLPSRLSLRNDAAFREDELLAVSMEQADRGRAMPIAVEMRATWDAMRPPYQMLMSGELDAASAAHQMQRKAEASIARMTRIVPRDWTATAILIATGIVVAGLAWSQRKAPARLLGDWRRNRLAYLLALPSIAVIVLTVVYPLAYNVALSFSNMSLTNLRDDQFVGVQNYASLASGEAAATFRQVFVKTIFWTAINVFFHVSIGVLLALALHGPLAGKAIYRVLLIIPWAVPAYITALTWRGMFDEQLGVVNQFLRAASWLNNYLPTWLAIGPVNWLGEAGPAFAACIIANVWLGFPFMMVVALGGLQGIPAELYEAARIDRATRWQQFWQITVPMLKPVLLPAITLGAVWTFNNLNVVWLVSNTGEPADQTHILVSYVYKAVFNQYQYGYGAALSMVIFGILLAFSLAFLGKTRATEGAV